MAKVSKRGGFSDRNGIKPENVEIQLINLDKRTRIQLQNMISQFYAAIFGPHMDWSDKDIQDFIIYVLGTVYSEPVDRRKYYTDDQIFNMINNTVINDDYDDVLTLIESLIQYWDTYLKRSRGYSYYNEYTGEYNNISLYDSANTFFEKEYVGYRFVDGIIVPISDTYEVKAIEEALNNRFKNVYEHISKANRLLADRDNPDYENSIKESISAVEAICKLITGTKGKEATLGNMLKKLEDNGVEIHKGMKTAFSILYGYTSDANGIRHAGDIGGPSSTFEEAKFMLIACCAFVNYLTAICAD